MAITEEFEYLGSTTTSDCSLDKEISSRINKAAWAFSSLSSVLWYQKSVKNKSEMMFTSLSPIQHCCMVVRPRPPLLGASRGYRASS